MRVAEKKMQKEEKEKKIDFGSLPFDFSPFFLKDGWMDIYSAFYLGFFAVWNKKETERRCKYKYNGNLGKIRR